MYATYATQAPPGYTTLRLALAAASEHLRTLPLDGEIAERVREVACAALAALSAGLLGDCDPEAGRLFAPLVADDVARIQRLLEEPIYGAVR